MSRLSFADLVAKARVVHGDRYEYVGDRVDGRYRRLTIKCKAHGEFEQSWDNHSMGKGCRKCATARNSEKQMHTLEEIKRLGSKLFDDQYVYLDLLRIPNAPKLRLACKAHGLFEQSLYSHLAGKGCYSCFVERSLDSDETVVSKARELHGDRYQYRGITKTKPRILTAICEVHGEFVQPVFNHLQGHGCSECGKLSMAGKAKWTVGELNSVNTTKWEVLNVLFVEGRSEAIAMCEYHGEFTKPVDKLLSGLGCPQCAFGLRAEKAMQSLEEYAEKASAIHNYAYTYKALDRAGSYPKVIANCAKHGDFSQGMAGHLGGSRCPACSNATSKVGKDFAEFILSLAADTVIEGSLPGSRYRWDAIVPSRQLAFEFHGLYWHSTEHKLPSYHLDKHKAGLTAGYRTIHVYEDEWSNRRDVVEKLIAHSLGVTAQGKHFARTCSSSIVPDKVAAEFLEANHIQGYTSGTHVGLYVEDTLLAILVYTLKDAGRRGASSERAEILRYATACTVVGGFSKLLKEMLRREPGVGQVVTFSDDRLFSGGMYEKTGFKAVARLRPDYFYVRYGKRLHKRGFQKSRFKSDATLQYSEGATEFELATLNNLHRVYDCGKTRWELQI